MSETALAGAEPVIEFEGDFEVISQLRSALASVAVAEAFASLDGIKDDPRIKKVAEEIIKRLGVIVDIQTLLHAEAAFQIDESDASSTNGNHSSHSTNGNGRSPVFESNDEGTGEFSISDPEIGALARSDLALANSDDESIFPITDSEQQIIIGQDSGDHQFEVAGEHSSVVRIEDLIEDADILTEQQKTLLSQLLKTYGTEEWFRVQTMAERFGPEYTSEGALKQAFNKLKNILLEHGLIEHRGKSTKNRENRLIPNNLDNSQTITNSTGKEAFELTDEQLEKLPSKIVNLIKGDELSEHQKELLYLIAINFEIGTWLSAKDIFSAIGESYSSKSAYEKMLEKLKLSLIPRGILELNGEHTTKSRIRLVDPDQSNESNRLTHTVDNEDEIDEVESNNTPSDNQDPDEISSCKPNKVADSNVSPPEVDYDGDIAFDTRLRRTDFIRINNLDEINEWISGINPYGRLAKVEIQSSRGLYINGKEHTFSEDQKELLNILFSNIGKPITMSEIFEMGFGDFYPNKDRQRRLNGSIERLAQIKLDDKGNRLIIVDSSTGDYQLNPMFELRDKRESVKKN